MIKVIDVCEVDIYLHRIIKHYRLINCSSASFISIPVCTGEQGPPSGCPTDWFYVEWSRFGTFDFWTADLIGPSKRLVELFNPRKAVAAGVGRDWPWGSRWGSKARALRRKVTQGISNDMTRARIRIENVKFLFLRNVL